MQKASSDLVATTMLPVMTSFTGRLLSSALIKSSVDTSSVVSSSIIPEPSQLTNFEIHSTAVIYVSGISTMKYMNKFSSILQK
jgi:hypothetical protein